VLVNGSEHDAADLREEIAGVLAGLGLRFSEAKTRVTHMSEGFSFLGFRIQWRRKRGTAKWYVYTFIDDRPIRSLKAKIRALTPRTSQLDTEYVLTRLNQVMQGWASYFWHAVAKDTFNMLDHFAWWRVIRMLMERHRWRWKDVRRWLVTPAGHWRPITGAGLNCGRSRQSRLPGTAIAAATSPAPGQLNQPDGRNRGEPVASRGARRVRREVRGNGPGAIPEPRPGPTLRKSWLRSLTGGEQDPFAEQRQAGAAEHLALDHAIAACSSRPGRVPGAGSARSASPQGGRQRRKRSGRGQQRGRPAVPGRPG